MTLDLEDAHTQTHGASALDTQTKDSLSLSAQEDSLNYASCPDEIKQLIEDTDLDKLVYWKLKNKLEKQNHSSQNEILKGVIADVERPLFAIVLSKTNGNQSKAAEVLGCNRNTLHRKLKEFFINPRDIKRSMKNKNTSKKYFSTSSSLAFPKNLQSKMADL